MARSVRAAIIVGFDQIVRELGGDPAVVQNATGVQLTQLVDPDTLISATLATNVLNLSAQETQCETFGLELAKRRNLDRYLGILDDILKAEPTLGDALRESFELFSIHSETTLWQLQTHGDVSYAVFSALEEPGLVYKQVQQLAIMLLWRLLNVLSDNRWHPTTVSFTFARPADDLPYRRNFKSYVEFDADFCGVIFHASDLDIELPGHNIDMLERFRAEAHAIQDERSVGFDESVRGLIRKNIELGQVGEEHITRFYPFERRTLQRKLRDLDTSYAQLLGEVRTGMAMELLADSDVSITRIADRLCYNDLPNFTKAFRQQTGMTPRTWRKQARLDASKP